jgi:lipopolysaccharide/colanic/teichoic acid biosynthesis glycosyltransferase
MHYSNVSSCATAASLQACQRTSVYPLIKRALETIFSLVLLVLLAPVFVLVTLAIKLDSPGPAIFRQTRIGKDGEPFTFYKFRSMFHDIDTSGHQAFMKAFVNGHVDQDKEIFKPAQDNQITQIGRLLRKTSLDELPQLINVIKGEMSFIGPRPNIPAEVEEYKDWHKRRLQALPGITGWAQVNGRSSLSFDQIARYDLEYIDRENLLMDLRIVRRTLSYVVQSKGAQ